MEITEFSRELLPAAVELFIENYKRLRQLIHVLPDLMENPINVSTRLERLVASCPGIAAVEDGKLVGYMGWILVNHFRSTQRKGAYCPVWGHATIDDQKQKIYNVMYREAATRWAAAGVQVHALSLLANDRVAEKTWFWNNFGLTVVDGIRSLQSVENVSPSDLNVRKATLNDVDALVALEAEHRRHYTEPPVFMASFSPESVENIIDFLQKPKNSYWMALDGEQLAGFFRFEGDSSGASEIVRSETTIAITGAFVKPQYRGRRAAPALLNAALKDYTRMGGIERCSVDFESFNPEAGAFWVKYFDPVCYSLTRIPEA
jgi:ribosomal protein S18 acetylase RimI-like enzyme